MDLPVGREWQFHADANLLILSSRLDVDGQERAIAEAWREHRIR